MYVFHIHVHIYQTGGTIFVRRGGCHPVQRGGAAQIVVVLTKLNIELNLTHMKWEAPFLHGEEGATLCSGEGLHR